MHTDEEAARGSYWLDTEDTAYPVLKGDFTTDVAIIGGGIVGLTTACLLKKAGKRVVVLEARQAGGQVTGRSTAKLTSLHRLVYADLADQAGHEAAQRYGEANQAGIGLIEDLVREHGIACDLQPTEAYTYCAERETVDHARREAQIAQQLGLPASWVDEAPLPVPNHGAVRFTGQAKFHPWHYARGLAAAIDGDGGRVFENTRVHDVEESERLVVDTDFAHVIAEHVVVATNLPILDRGGFFSKAYPRSHVALAAEIDPATAPIGMFISAEEPTRSIRTHNVNGRMYLIAVGDAYKTGQQDPQPLAADLQAWVQRHFAPRRIVNTWTNEDFQAMDGRPFVGPLRSSSQRVWTATGFGGWGLSAGTAAAMMLCDRILGRDNPWAGLFESTRLDPVQSAGRFIGENANVAKAFVQGSLHTDTDVAATIGRGSGAVVKVDGEKIAMYRDEQGNLLQVSAKCTHMGCQVTWNPIDRTWDCPCHGSRFLPDGSVLFGPAVHALSPVMPKRAD